MEVTHLGLPLPLSPLLPALPAPVVARVRDRLELAIQRGFTQAPERQTLQPIGPDNGKTVYFFRYAGDRLRDKPVALIDRQSHWNEEIEQARHKGYTVVTDSKTTRADFLQALYHPQTAGIIFNGHGAVGQIGLAGESEGFDRISPIDIDPRRVSPHLQLVVFQTCDTTITQDAWDKALHGAAVIGWDRKVNVLEIARANNPDWPDFFQDAASHQLDRILDHHL